MTLNELRALSGRQGFAAAVDAVGHTAKNLRLTLGCLARNGADILSAEKAIFEWLHHADSDQFRKPMALVKNQLALSI